jgi:hypothetical protein
MMRGWRLVFLVAALAWSGALVYSMLVARILYADGGAALLGQLIDPLQFKDYGEQRSFAGYIVQAPVVLGQLADLQSVASYAALYALGMFGVTAAAMLAALFLSRRQPLLFAANALAVVVFGFGVNFINSEANLLFGFVWLSMTILALDRPAPKLRGWLLPALAFALLRVYEGMMLVGPILAVWAFVAITREANKAQRVGLALASVLFFAAAAIGFAGVLSPQDPANAAGFVASTTTYFQAPQRFLLLSSLAAVWAIFDRRQWARIAAAIACAAFGLAFLWAIVRVQGYYAYIFYYRNRGFLVLSLPVFAVAIAAIAQWRPRWLAAASAGPTAILLVPIVCAVAGDLLGSFRWHEYTQAFCLVLRLDATPAERLERLKRSSVMTGWGWTHPVLSILLRERGSDAMVANDPGGRMKPFPMEDPPRITELGLCQASPLGSAPAPEPPRGTIVFQGAAMPPWVALIRGLSGAEPWGTWSEGSRVEIVLAQPLPPSFDLGIRLSNVFGSNGRLPVRVRVGDKEQSFVPDHLPFEATLAFRDVGASRTVVSFEIPKPESPLELGMSKDPRKLGIGFFALTVTPR